MDNDYLVDKFVKVTKGNSFRIFPFGTIYKNGVKREMTPEFAKTIKLPHFKPPIKLSSHDDNAPAGGFIVGLEVKDDGLYAIPEWNEAGNKAIQEGAYRYNSPEILWSGGIENPKDGSIISAPMVLATALLHTPHLGEGAALYSIKVNGDTDMEETIQMPKSFWDKFVAPLFVVKPEIQTVEKEPEDYATAKQERDEYKTKLEAIEAEKNRVELFNSIVTELQNKEKFGSMYVELKAAQEAAEVMAGMSDEQREWCMRNFSALTAQIEESKLTGERGSEGATEQLDPKAAFNAAVLAVVAEKSINYNAAFEVVKAEKPDMFKAAFAK